MASQAQFRDIPLMSKLTVGSSAHGAPVGSIEGDAVGKVVVAPLVGIKVGAANGRVVGAMVGESEGAAVVLVAVGAIVVVARIGAAVFAALSVFQEGGAGTWVGAAVGKLTITSKRGLLSCAFATPSSRPWPKTVTAIKIIQRTKSAKAMNMATLRHRMEGVQGRAFG